MPDSQHYFHRWPADRDPAELLRPENHVSTPWGTPDHGACDKCHSEGTTRYRCASCLALGVMADCPACGGRVEFEDVCPTCEGTGEIARIAREGISVFPTLEGLYRYLSDRRADPDGTVVLELEGELTGDRDLDADAGALLVRPTRIVGEHPPAPAGRR